MIKLQELKNQKSAFRNWTAHKILYEQKCITDLHEKKGEKSLASATPKLKEHNTVIT